MVGGAESSGPRPASGGDGGVWADGGMIVFFVLNRRFFVRPDKNKNPQMGILILVALVGLEPTLLAELDFESSASTNSATGPWTQAVSYYAACFASTFFTKRALRFAL